MPPWLWKVLSWEAIIKIRGSLPLLHCSNGLLCYMAPSLLLFCVPRIWNINQPLIGILDTPHPWRYYTYKGHDSNTDSLACVWNFIMRAETYCGAEPYCVSSGRYTMWYIQYYITLNSSWHSDAIWWHGSGSTLAQVMAWCLMAPSHYLNQWWVIISKVK